MANKKKTKADRPKTDNPNVKGLHAEVLETSFLHSDHPGNRLEQTGADAGRARA
mgnify:CR=1 FL=1